MSPRNLIRITFSTTPGWPSHFTIAPLLMLLPFTLPLPFRLPFALPFLLFLSISHSLALSKLLPPFWSSCGVPQEIFHRLFLRFAVALQESVLPHWIFLDQKFVFEVVALPVALECQRQDRGVR